MALVIEKNDDFYFIDVTGRKCFEPRKVDENIFPSSVSDYDGGVCTIAPMEIGDNFYARTLTIMISPFLISRFLFLWYVYAETALASTSEESAMPTAIYGSMPRNVMSIGLMTAAALIPAKPVPSPAPTPAKNVTNIVVSKLILLCLPFCFPYDFKGRIII